MPSFLEDLDRACANPREVCQPHCESEEPLICKHKEAVKKYLDLSRIIACISCSVVSLLLGYYGDFQSFDHSPASFILSCVFGCQAVLVVLLAVHGVCTFLHISNYWLVIMEYILWVLSSLLGLLCLFRVTLWPLINDKYIVLCQAMISCLNCAFSVANLIELLICTDDSFESNQQKYHRIRTSDIESESVQDEISFSSHSDTESRLLMFASRSRGKEYWSCCDQWLSPRIGYLKNSLLLAQLWSFLVLYDQLRGHGIHPSKECNALMYLSVGFILLYFLCYIQESNPWLTKEALKVSSAQAVASVPILAILEIKNFRKQDSA